MPDINTPSKMSSNAATRLVNPFVLFREQNAASGGFFRGDTITMNHNSGAVFRKHGNDVTLVEKPCRYAVNPNEMIDRWAKWVNGELMEQKIYRTAAGEMAPPTREALGLDLDEHDWPIEKGKPKDPWQRDVHLPMRGADGDVVAFKATGKGAIAEIGELVGMYGSSDRGGKVPVVEIDSRSFDTKHGSTVHVPVFRLVGWESWDGQPVPMAQPVAVPVAPPPPPLPQLKIVKPAAPPADPLKDGMDDEIPF